jgi:hypothetical protein
MNTTSPAQLDRSEPRTRADELTLAYVVKGATKVLLRENPFPDLDAFSGEKGFIEQVMQPALLIDRVADYFDAVSQHTGVFCYEVAEPFGESYAMALLCSVAVTPKAILRQVMIDAQYAEEEVDRAFTHAAHQGESPSGS